MQLKEQSVIWLQGAGCTGCSVSLMNSVSPTLRNLLLDEIVPGKHLNLLFHPTLMAASGDIAIEVLRGEREQSGYLLVVEGAIPAAKNGVFATVGEREGKPVTVKSHLVNLAKNALGIIAIGNCAAFGGFPAARPNPTGSRSVEEVLGEEGINIPVINVPGCPPHPDWFVGTVADIILHGLPSREKLDELKRPRFIYGQLIHENCPRKPYFDEGKFARNFGEEGCLYELGCKGPFTYADCPNRHWNGGVNWVIGAGSPCLGCVEPTFPDVSGPFYRKISDWEKFKLQTRKESQHG